MRDRALRRLAWAWGALIGACLVAEAVFAYLNRDSSTTTSVGWSGSGPLAAIASAPLLLFPGVGLLLALKRPRNSIGWIMLGIGQAIAAPFGSYARYALLARHGTLPGGPLAAALDGPTWIPLIGLAGIFLILLFPDGHLPSMRWRWFARAAAASMAVSMAAIFLAPGKFESFPKVTNPYGVRGVDVLFLTILFIPLAIVGASVSLILRYRRSRGVDRLQLKWLAAAAVVVASVYLVVEPLSAVIGSPNPGWLLGLQDLALLTFGLIPLAIAFSVLKYRLLDIDLVINKTLVFATLAVFITAVYVAVVVGVGAAVGGVGNPLLSAAAAALVALAFQPARRRAQKLADRLVYGQRATPYEVLSAFSDRLAGAYANEDLLPRMARILAEGTGAVTATVWLRSDAELHPAATWPTGYTAGAPVPVDRLPDDLIPVRHQGELLGALSVEKKPGESLGATEQKLVADLAAQAGLVLRNVTLIEDLKASRLRLVAAQDAERRKLERNLHDGAQQQLVALSVKARLARSLAGKDPARSDEMLGALQSDITDALETLRDLARGIYPPLLADKGLVAALQAQARRSTVPVSVVADDLGRHGQDVEAAVYFCCLETLQNVAKYAHASQVDIRLGDGDGSLTFEVEDDGVGFDVAATTYGTGLQGMADRLAALEGRLDISSTPGGGTKVIGRIPATEVDR
jgi:signal transduction histidine kinase